MSSSESHATITYRSISSDSNLPPWGFHLMDPDKFEAPEEAPQSPEQAPTSPDYVPGPEYPEYLVPSDDEVPIDDQPVRADASPTALSPSYVANSDPEEDPEEDPANYSANEDDEEEESSEEDEEEDEEEEHLPLANSALPAIDYVPSAEEMEPFETNEPAATPPPPPQTIFPVSMTRLHRARIFVRPHTPPSPSTEALIAEFASAPTPPSPPPSPLSPLSSPLYRIQSPPLHTSLMMTSNNVYFITSFIPFSKRRAFWSLNEDILKITILKTNTPYPSKKIRRIRACTHQRPQKDKDQYAILDLSMEAEFPAIVVNDFAPQDTLQCKSQVSTPFINEIDFRTSFDESDDEDYIIICDKNSFFYKMIPVNNLKTDSEIDYEKVMPSIPSPEPAISYCDDLDFYKDFENEFPAIVYNDAQTSKSDLLTEPILNPQHIDEFDLNDETSLSEYDEEEQNVLYFSDLFPFNIICSDDLKSEKDKDNNDIDITQSLLDNEITHGYEGLGYTDSDIADFESRLERIYTREIHRVHVVDFQGMPELLRDGLFARMAMEHRDEAGVVEVGEVLLDLDAPGTIQFQLGGARRRLSWRQFILALGLHTGEEMESPGFARYWSESERMIPGKGDLHDYWRDISTDGDFLGPPPSYTLIRDPVLRLCHRMMAHSIAGRSQAPEKVTVTDLFYLRGLDVGSVNIPYLLARYLRRFAAGRKSGAHISGGQFVGRLAQHFRLLTAEILGGLTVVAPELQMIDMAELVRLQICVQLDDTWAWVAMGPERQPDAAAGAPAVAEDAPAVDEGDQAVPAPVQAPQQPPPPPPAAARTVPQRLGRLEEDVQGLRRDVGSLRGLVERSMTDQGRFSTWMMTCMTQLMDASGLTYQAFDGTF
ncbi:hypothetical protein Tco_0934501 [Tanacetum coccineum]